MTSLNEIHSRAEKQPCTNYEDHACSRGDRVKLLAALDAVLTIHGPSNLGYPDTTQRWCSSCIEHDDNVEYPCPTVRAVTAALEGGAS